jgi:hypothetical protein
VLSGITTWGYVRLRVAQFLANLWQGAYMAVYGQASAPSSGSPDRKRLATSGARAGPTKGVGLRSAADLGARGQHGQPELLAAMN